MAVDSRLAVVAAHFYQLTRTEGWDTYRLEIERLIANHVERWINSGKDSELIRGHIQGLREALDLPPRKLAEHKRANA